MSLLSSSPRWSLPVVGAALGAFMMATAPAQQAEACALCNVDQYKVVNVQPYEVLNIRARPTVRSQIVGAIPPNGQNVIHVGGRYTNSRGTLWLEVAYYNTNGWVNSNYLKLTRPAGPVFEPNPVGPSGHYTVDVSRHDTLNVRKKPGHRRPIIISLPRGTKVKALGKERYRGGAKWWKIQYNGWKGWVNAQYLKKWNPHVDADHTTPPHGIYRVKVGWGNSLNLRKRPNLNSPILAKLPHRSRVKATGKVRVKPNGSRWWKVRQHGQVGWVNAKYLRPVQPHNVSFDLGPLTLDPSGHGLSVNFDGHTIATIH